MPCNCDYLEATNIEIEMSRVACLLDELKGISIKKSCWDGYHSSVYCQRLTKERCDKMVEQLCSKLQKLDVTKYSLKMQIWWRDHQDADKKRLEKELAEHKMEADKQQALNKLTKYERDLLGL